MNAIAEIKPRTDSRLGWAPSIARLRAEYDLARKTAKLDPWMITEAKCWIQLIEAELSAKSTKSDPDLCARLLEWRQEITSLLVRMRALQTASADPSKTFSGPFVSQRAG